MIRFNAPAAECETETKSRPIVASLLERAEQIIGIPDRQAAALVFDFDKDTFGAGAHAQR